MENKIDCPKCGSTQLSANKKGFSVGKAAAGVFFAGGVGLLAGAIGGGNIMITCLNCGCRFKAGEYKKEKSKYENEKVLMSMQAKTKDSDSYIGPIISFIIFSILGFAASYNLFINEWNFLGFVFAFLTIICVAIVILLVYSENALKSNTDKSKEQSLIKKNEKLEIDYKIREYVRNGELTNAIEYCKKQTGSTEIEAENYVDLISSKL